MPPLSVHSRMEDAPDDQPWTRHATGALRAGAEEVSAALLVWPPADAEPVRLDGVYDSLPRPASATGRCLGTAGGVAAW